MFLPSRYASLRLPSPIVGVLAKALSVPATETFAVVTVSLPVMAGVVGIETAAIARVFLPPPKPIAKAFLLFPVIPPVISTIPPVIPTIPAIIPPIVPAIPAIIPAIIPTVPAPSPSLRLNSRKTRKTRSNHEANCKKQRYGISFDFVNVHLHIFT